MKDAAYRVAMNYIQNKNSDKVPFKSFLTSAMNRIKQGKIKTREDLIEYLKTNGYTVKEFSDNLAQFVRSEPTQDKDRDLLMNVAIFFSENDVDDSNIDLLQKSWWERNISDEYVKKQVKEKLWFLFRNNNWIKRNQIS